MTSSMLQRIHLGGQITELCENSFNLVKEALDCYKTIRADIPKSIPFYPIGLPKYGDDIACVAFDCTNYVRLCVWCFSDEQEVIIPLKGSNLKVLYPSDTDAKTKLTDEGISVKFQKAYLSVVIEVERK